MVQRALLIVGTLAMAALAGAQPAQQEEAEGSDLIISVESNLVVVPLHVYRKKSSVNGLGREAFELLEDGVPQNIAFVEGPPADGEVSQRSIPTEIIFLIDFSYSVMTPGLLDFYAIRSTMLEGLRQDVQISVYGFASKLRIFTGPTRDLQKLQKALDQSFESEAGGSRVYEAIMQTARHASSRGGNVSRMMVVFSDGLSTTNLDPELVVRSANAFGIPIYPVVLGHERIRQRAQGLAGGVGIGRAGQTEHRQPNPAGLGGGNQQGARRGEPEFSPRQQPQGQLNRQSNSRSQETLQQIFAEIGPKTGGRSYDLPVINSKVIRQILGSLSTLAETEYVVGYYPSAVDEELTAHAVEVRLRSEEFGQLYGGRRFVVH
ncbi:MAG: VWA domain-containing protein [Bryobacterales bacterium]|nr:VWA domain-containing protein [Bryobacterales bacterium]